MSASARISSQAGRKVRPLAEIISKWSFLFPGLKWEHADRSNMEGLTEQPAQQQQGLVK